MKSAISAIEELVRAVAETAAHGKVKVSERIEALRVLAPYYVALKKGKIPIIDGEDDKITINRLQDAVRQAEDNSNGGRTVSDYQRRGRGSEALEN